MIIYRVAQQLLIIQKEPKKDGFCSTFLKL